jgi:hypothetical protein
MQSIRSQSGEGAEAARMCAWRENLPAVEVVGVNVEDDVDEAPDVVDADGLGVKVEEGGGLLEQ